jgi:hypothetical protein
MAGATVLKRRLSAVAARSIGAVSALYDADVLQWSERQADLLRRVANGERVNEADLDWPNIVEEIESVGRSQLSAVKSYLLQALLHDLKAEAWPLSPSVPHWRSEARVARYNAAEAYVPSMRQRIDLAAIYAKARHAIPDTSDGQPPQPLPDQCPVTLDELLSDA